MAAAIPLGKILIENDLKKERKRKAQAIGVFLNVETQRKFMKMASNVELRADSEQKDDFIDELQGNASVLLDYNKQLLLENLQLHGHIFDLKDALTEAWRPRHKDIDWGTMSKENAHRNDFLMDFENACLADFRRDNRFTSDPVGTERYKEENWAEFMKTQVYPAHSDVDWTEYVAWVRAGMGDAWSRIGLEVVGQGR